jgi:hypothetical protein
MTSKAASSATEAPPEANQKSARREKSQRGRSDEEGVSTGAAKSDRLSGSIAGINSDFKLPNCSDVGIIDLIKIFDRGHLWLR